MIEFRYLRTGPYVDHGREVQCGADLAVVSAADLRWYYFLSDLSFTIDDVELTLPWSWTPVFDFLWSMKGVLGQLERGEHSAIGFTENAELIEFAPVAERVKVSCTYSRAEAICGLTDLGDAWLNFRQDVLNQLAAEYPRLAVNPALGELRT
ncbi:hypothetical protein [Actinoplanes derwentensis]|uniref:Uncharacterized protein n=1 Tax=Actinoplanes derwentensis TaxID=113562 RepID=A0A1H1Y2L3_9ACTN|nr:hypothetical protein [Actinoplanes derwentensis]GID86764.1 hypothetical protein Ade03nite_56880 [Actinoplanes derwentensis]SDT15226.1 hypothetical protein SAMN04489716_2668 [Actinoplanes derwentensis]